MKTKTILDISIVTKEDVIVHFFVSDKESIDLTLNQVKSAINIKELSSYIKGTISYQYYKEGEEMINGICPLSNTILKQYSFSKA